MSRAAFDAWLKDHGGQILNISATLHYGGTPGQGASSQPPSAAVDLAPTRTSCQRSSGARRRIRVNAIAPGPIGDTTEGVRRLLPGEAAGAAEGPAIPSSEARFD